MERKRCGALLLASIFLVGVAFGAQAQGQAPDDRGQGSDRSGESGDDASNGTAGRDDHPDQPQNRTPQGRALGRDGEWHACRDAAENETERQACLEAAMERAIERHNAIRAARENGSIGGELTIAPGQNRIDDANGVRFEVNMSDPAESGHSIRVQVGAELDRGQTIVLDVDPEMLNTTLDELLIAYYDVADDGSETLNTSFTEADSLQDVLDPDDDDEAEYWIIEDHEGYHVLVSIPSWSVHSITLTGQLTIPEETTSAAPIVAVILLGAVFVSFFVVVWMQRPRRGDD